MHACEAKVLWFLLLDWYLLPGHHLLYAQDACELERLVFLFLFILILERLLIWKYRFLSLGKRQALARFTSQNRNPYFKINLKQISGILQIGRDLSSQYRQARLRIRRQAYAWGCAFHQWNANPNYFMKMSVSACTHRNGVQGNYPSIAFPLEDRIFR